MGTFLRGLYWSDKFFDDVIEIRGSEFSIYQKNLLHGPVPLADISQILAKTLDQVKLPINKLVISFVTS